jgi:hypothetical protein
LSSNPQYYRKKRKKERRKGRKEEKEREKEGGREGGRGGGRILKPSLHHTNATLSRDKLCSWGAGGPTYAQSFLHGACIKCPSNLGFGLSTNSHRGLGWCIHGFNWAAEGTAGRESVSWVLSPHWPSSLQDNPKECSMIFLHFAGEETEAFLFQKAFSSER